MSYAATYAYGNDPLGRRTNRIDTAALTNDFGRYGHE